MRAELAAVVESVTASVLPNIRTEAVGPELRQVVESKAREAFIDGLADPDLDGMDVRSLRTVLAIRVGLSVMSDGR